MKLEFKWRIASLLASTFSSAGKQTDKSILKTGKDSLVVKMEKNSPAQSGNSLVMTRRQSLAFIGKHAFAIVNSIMSIIMLLSVTGCIWENDITDCPNDNGDGGNSGGGGVYANNRPVKVNIHWDDKAVDDPLPSQMSVWWYPEDQREMWSVDFSSPYGGMDYLYPDTFMPICLDFYGNANLAFRSSGKYYDVEVYNRTPTGSTPYDLWEKLPNEKVALDVSSPYRFYIDAVNSGLDIESKPSTDTVIVDFYPENVLHEYTFMIYDVTGSKNIKYLNGAMSGLAATLRPVTGTVATTPTTLLFDQGRFKVYQDARNQIDKYPELAAYKQFFTAYNPTWQTGATANADPRKGGWTGDWITGAFSCFGVTDPDANVFRLTVIATGKNNYYPSAWGYYHGQWEETVADQMKGALTDPKWRDKNGGFDIVLWNDGRLDVPDYDAGGSGSDNGFNVNIDDWGDPVIVGGATMRTSTSAAKRRFKEKLETRSTRSNIIRVRAPLDTTNLSNFYVSGLPDATAATETGATLFNEEYIYKSFTEGRWDYYPKKYWPSDGNIQFYAVAPASLEGLTTGLKNNGAYGTPPTLSYSMPLVSSSEAPPPGWNEPGDYYVVDPTGQQDMLVAVNELPSPQDNPVPLHFQHALSRVSVSLRVSAATFQNDKRYRITRAELINVYTKAKLQLTFDNTSGGVSTGIPSTGGFVYGATPVVLWNNYDALAALRLSLDGSAVQIYDNAYTQLSAVTEPLYVLPQEFSSGLQVYVEYEVYSIVGGGEAYDGIGTATITATLPTGALEIGRWYEIRGEI